MTRDQATKPARLMALDAARFFAFVGMVLVNFNIVMGNGTGAGWSEALLQLLQGKAAATFVVLAGLGFALGFSSSASDAGSRVQIVAKRVAFLFALGMLNQLIFPADILHFYAGYMLVGLFCLGLSKRWLLTATTAITALFCVLVFVADYEAGWDWATLTYVDFWSITGFARNFLFNGWHPIVPWSALFVFGMFLSQLSLRETRTQYALLVLGGAGLFVSITMAHLAAVHLPVELAELLGTAPLPPGPVFVLAGVSSASIVVGLCLLLEPIWLGAGRLIVSAGKQALTLYAAHILIGMGVIELLGSLSSHPSEVTVLASLGFAAISLVYVALFDQCFSSKGARGPLETLMRKLTS